MSSTGQWMVREDEVTGGLTIESEHDEDVYINICPEAVPAIAAMKSENVYVDAGDRQYCYLFDFPHMLKGALLFKVTKLYWSPGSKRESRFRFSMHFEFRDGDVERIIEEALRLEGYDESQDL